MKIYQRGLWHVLLVVLFFLNLYFLLTASDVLLIAVIKEPYVPLGNLMSWASLIILPYYVWLFFRWVLQRESAMLGMFFLRINYLVLFLAAAWGVISYLTFGNWAFNNSRGDVYRENWTLLTAAIVIIPLLSVLSYGFWALIQFILRKLKAKR